MLSLLLLLMPPVPAPESPFTVPTQPAAPAPPPTPPAAATVLNAGELYVINSKVDASVRGYPAGLVKVTKHKGPMTVHAKFAGGASAETREFPGPHVFLVEAVNDGKVDLVGTPFGLKSDAEIAVWPVDVKAGKGPQPPPPGPAPAPAPTGKIKSVVLVYGNTVTQEQHNVMYGVELEKWLGANADVWRRRHQASAGAADPATQELWKHAQPKITVVPCVVVETSTGIEIINLEGTQAKMIEVLNAYRGK